MQKANTKLVVCLNIVFFVMGILLPISGWASPSLGQISDSLMGPTEIVTKLVLVACYMVGVGLVIFALAQYKQHRQSPKLVPLTTPILLLILGIIALLIPYVTTMSDESGSATEQAKREGKTNPKAGAMAPLPQYESKQLPGPGRYTPSDVQGGSSGYAPEDDYDADDVPNSGNWTDDYN